MLSTLTHACPPSHCDVTWGHHKPLQSPSTAEGKASVMGLKPSRVQECSVLYGPGSQALSQYYDKFFQTHSQEAPYMFY